MPKINPTDSKKLNKKEGTHEDSQITLRRRKRIAGGGRGRGGGWGRDEGLGLGMGKDRRDGHENE